MIDLKKKFKWLIGIIGIIFLGALGSGFWDIALKPFFLWLVRFILYISSFGIETYKNTIYSEIAKGHHNEEVLKLITLSIVFFGFFLGRVHAILDMNSEKNSFFSRIIGENKKRVEFFMKLVLFLLAWFFIVSFSRITFTNTAITYYEQCLAIISPYISNEEKDKIHSKFA